MRLPWPPGPGGLGRRLAGVCGLRGIAAAAGTAAGLRPGVVADSAGGHLVATGA